MNVRMWLNFFMFLKELIGKPEFKRFRNKDNRARNLFMLAFLGMFIFAMVMSEQAFVYSTEKHEIAVLNDKLKREVRLCEASLPYYTRSMEEE